MPFISETEPISGFSAISFCFFSTSLIFSNIFRKNYEHSNNLRYQQKKKALFWSILFEALI